VNETQILQYIVDAIEKLRKDNENFLAAGRAINFDEYRHVCGVIRGLNHAENIINDLAQKMELTDD
jgi:hypothetical protein